MSSIEHLCEMRDAAKAAMISAEIEAENARDLVVLMRSKIQNVRHNEWDYFFHSFAMHLFPAIDKFRFDLHFAVLREILCGAHKNAHLRLYSAENKWQKMKWEIEERQEPGIHARLHFEKKNLFRIKIRVPPREDKPEPPSEPVPYAEWGDKIDSYIMNHLWCYCGSHTSLHVEV